MSTASSNPKPLAETGNRLLPALSVLIATLIAAALGPALSNCSRLRVPLSQAVLAKPIADSMDDYGGLVYRTLSLASQRPQAGAFEIYFTGSSVLGFSVNIPTAQNQLQQRLAGRPVTLENFWAQNATAADTLLWLNQLPKGRPSVLVYGLYYKSLEPGKRKPYVRHLFPVNNASLLKTLYGAHTAERQASWDPNGEAPPTEGYWNPPRWSAQQHLTQTLAGFKPFERLPNAETRALDQLVSACQQRGTRLILIRTPLHPDFYAEYKKMTAQAGYESYMAELASRTEVWDWEALLPEGSQFSDAQHLSAQGREAFTRRLVEKLGPTLNAALPVNSRP